MGLTTLTAMEERWMKRARTAVNNGESWEHCTDCRGYHPEQHDGACDDAGSTLPGRPEELLAQ